MKIVDVKTLAVRNVEPFRGGQHFLFVQLVTDEGIIGLGERPAMGLKHLAAHAGLMEELARLHLVGSDPFDVELLWQRMYASRHDSRHPSLYATSAIGALEMAMWDIIGKAVKQPIYKLLGGRCHEKLRAYGYMPMPIDWKEPQKAGEIVAMLLEKGSTACKFDPFQPLMPQPRDISLQAINHAAKMFRAMRDAVGDRMEIALGTHGQFTTASAIRVINALEEFNPYWFEEPLPPENIDELARVASQTSVPIAAGERLVTKFEFAQVLKKQAAQIIQMDVAHCGGLLEAKKIAGMAEAHYAMIAPHMACGPVAAAAAIQLSTCSPNFLIQEFNTTPQHIRLLKEPIRIQNGFIIPPTGPGLGIELDEQVVSEFRIEL